MTRLKSLFLEGILIEYMACGDVVPLGTQQVLQEQGLPSSAAGVVGEALAHCSLDSKAFRSKWTEQG